MRSRWASRSRQPPTLVRPHPYGASDTAGVPPPWHTPSLVLGTLRWVTHISVASVCRHIPGPFLRAPLICLYSSMTATLQGLQSHPVWLPRALPALQIMSSPSKCPWASAPTLSGTVLLGPQQPASSQQVAARPRCSDRKPWCCACLPATPTTDPWARPAGSLSTI